MTSLLALESLSDPQKRLGCSVCWNLHQGDFERLWLFERYRDTSGEQVPGAEIFELRRQGDVVEWREDAPTRPAWSRFPGGTVFCYECFHSRRTYAVYDPRTGEAADV